MNGIKTRPQKKSTRAYLAPHSSRRSMLFPNIKCVYFFSFFSLFRTRPGGRGDPERGSRGARGVWDGKGGGNPYEDIIFFSASTCFSYCYRLIPVFFFNIVFRLYIIWTTFFVLCVRMSVYWVQCGMGYLRPLLPTYLPMWSVGEKQVCLDGDLVERG